MTPRYVGSVNRTLSRGCGTRTSFPFMISVRSAGWSTSASPGRWGAGRQHRRSHRGNDRDCELRRFRWGRTRVSVIDTAGNRVIASIPAGKNPTSISVRPDGRQAYVADEGDDSVEVLNPSPVAKNSS